MLQFIYPGVTESLRLRKRLCACVRLYDGEVDSFWGVGKEDCWACSSSPVLTSLLCWTPTKCSEKTNEANSLCWIYPAQVCKSSGFISGFTGFYECSFHLGDSDLFDMTISFWRTWQSTILTHIYLPISVSPPHICILLALILVTEVNGKPEVFCEVSV